MKKYKLFLLILICSNTFCLAQIGINTNNPLSLFHVDSQSNTTQDGLNESDDVMYTLDGNMGIGMYPDSTAKLQISTFTDHISPIKLEDGNQGLNKVLGVLNNSGDIGWIKTPSTSWSFVRHLVTPMVIPQATSYTLFQSPVIPESGNYIVIIRWRGKNDIKGAKIGSIISSYFYLDSYLKAEHVDGIEYYIPYWVDDSVYSFSVFLRGFLDAGDSIVIKMVVSSTSPNEGSYSWLTGVDGSDIALNPSILIFKL